MIRTLLYTPEKGIKENLSLEELKPYLKRKESIIWVDLEKPSEEDYRALSTAFDFHPLAIEDCKAEFNLPKVDDYENYLFIIWYALADVPETAEIESSQADMFLGRNFLVSVHVKKIADIDSLYERCLKNPEFMSRGVDWLLHNLLDNMVDDAFLLVDRMSDEIDELEDEIFESPTQDHVKRLFILKRQMLTIRKIAAPQREIISVLLRYELPFLGKHTYVYFQDISDHLIRIIDLVDTARDVITGAMDVYLSTTSNKLNEVMKKLTVVATIFIPLTLITGVYGMNFKYMPELYWTYGYFAVWVLMIVFAVGMFIYFKRRQWW
ncbi:MAG TPA: magnesium and cobalt transport protein CorA [Actinobacteria bacterium]|nr:magnesium and cobalt transport protein CorA [Actinomycetota bacterium]